MGLTNTNSQGANTGNYWADNETWVYTGQFFDADGNFSFAESIDDRAQVKIDGREVLRNSQWFAASTTGSADSVATLGGNNGGSNFAAGDVFTGENTAPDRPQSGFNFGMGNAGDGWHDIEIRFQNGGGGAGPAGGLGWGGGDDATYMKKGFGLNVDGSSSTNGDDYIIPIETNPDAPTLFRVAQANTGGTIAIDGGSTLRAGSTTGASLIVFSNGSLSAPSRFELSNNAAG
jgi:hypothetical protein